MSDYVLAIHGGAGSISKSYMTDEKEAAYEGLLRSSLEAGEAILKQGGSARAAVIAAIQVMEDSPLFNAGHGSVFTTAETIELSAAIMDGSDRAAGAIAAAAAPRNPIVAANAVLEHSDHVLLCGSGADNFAAENNVPLVAAEYFHDPRRLAQLRKLKAKQSAATLDHDGEAATVDSSKIEFDYLDTRKELGTVGAVALDHAGNVAAGTSTGGMTNQVCGRIGDTPSIGAGTFADNASCAISCTGHGEFFIRYAVAYDVVARMQYGKESLLAAAENSIHGPLKAAGGTGGLIAVDRQGNVAMPFNTSGMYRGFVKASTEPQVAIYQN